MNIVPEFFSVVARRGLAWRTATVGLRTVTRRTMARATCTLQKQPSDNVWTDTGHGELLYDDLRHTSSPIVPEQRTTTPAPTPRCEKAQTVTEDPDDHANVLRGRAYEKLTVEVLRAYGLDIKAMGGAGDEGIDFRGSWRLPGLDVDVAGQCKHYTTAKCGPAVIREFEGALARWQDAASTIGIVVSTVGSVALAPAPLMYRRFSNMALKQFKNSRCPIILCTLPTLDLLSQTSDLQSAGVQYFE